MQFLVIEGNIGAGKTSLVKMLCNDLNGKPIYEQFNDNPFLPKFYKNPDQFAFPLEMSFMAERYNQLHKQLCNLNLFHDITIADYYFIKSLIFAEVTLKKDEFYLYKKFFDIITPRIHKPNLYVYLFSSTNKLLDNIKKRGRDYEQNIDKNYLEKIQNGYITYLNSIRDFPVLMVNIENIDFVNNTSDYEKLKQLIVQNTYKTGIVRVDL